MAFFGIRKPGRSPHLRCKRTRNDTPMQASRTTLKGRRSAFVLLASALLLALAPIGWLGEVWRPLGSVLDGRFNSVAAHALAHAGIFFLLGLALPAAFPAVRARPLWFFGFLLAVAIGQEGIQLLYKQRPLVFDDLRDIVTDLVGMAAAFALVRARPGGLWPPSDTGSRRGAAPPHLPGGENR